MPRESGASSTPRLLDSITTALEYWIIRWSLSSGGACADPVADDDGRVLEALEIRHRPDARQMYHRAGRNIACPNFA
jgi:hypothetical protein